MVMNFLKICNTPGRYFPTSWLLFEKSERFLKKPTRITCAFTCGHYNFQSKVQHRLTHFLENFWFTEDFIPSEPHNHRQPGKF